MSFDLENLISWRNAANLLDIVLVWYLVYKLIFILKGTRAIQLLQGVLIVVLMKLIAVFLQLGTIDWIINQVVRWGVVAVIIIFQPEIRRGLEHLGKAGFRNRSKTLMRTGEMFVQEIDKAIQYMARRKIGALISVELNDSLEEYARTGIAVNGSISNQLLINIFIPNTPLHDGAVIIQDFKITSAASYLPLSENPLISKDLGTRHRAAIGLSEVTDAVTIIVSEETGGVSIAHQNKLHRDMSREDFVAYLTEQFVIEEEDDDEDNKPNLLQEFFDNLKWGNSE
ncbi:diadenylate cyclase CdaA [Jeotgalibaca ciconiae]|uniref:Diadenylate cyclase n=1 Tax=Jeotgalibaca ciconiae TaxID=2496265 RepID=A0A3Q9BKG5_9LACT|nr:diadenylate cyclase CdaA [Jeotgalibaca ciconiae]AZP04391.1 TIGR00159 family protein [Jeotgalibaca ciconiae]HJB22830.1 diadenylate cyclase CdaA [Candidatus Jeotgalibaca pullicola]